MITGKECWVLSKIIISVWDMKKFDMNLYVNLMIKNYDFDRVALFVDLEWLKSIDFTGGLSDWWVVNWLVLMCYFIIIYGIFGWVREKLYFSRVWGEFLSGMR